MTPRRRAVLAAAGAAPPARVHLLRRHRRRPAGAAAGREPRTAARPSRAACPAERAAPDPDRPVVALDFRLEDDLRTVTGTRDRRLHPRPADSASWSSGWCPTPPSPPPAGNRLVVDDVAGPGRRLRRLRGRGRGRPRWPLRGRRSTTSWRRGSPPRWSWTSRSRSGDGAFDRLGADDGRLLVGQRRPAAGLGAGRRLGPGPLRRRRPARRPPAPSPTPPSARLGAGAASPS